MEDLERLFVTGFCGVLAIAAIAGTLHAFFTSDWWKERHSRRRCNKWMKGGKV